MCVPIRYEPTSRKKLLIAICRESVLRAAGRYSLVNERKIGLPPSGSTMGNRALTKRMMLRTVSIAVSLVSFACPVEFRMSRRVSHVRIGTRVGEPRNTPSELFVLLRGRMKK
jgi:hypothetical protein